MKLTISIAQMAVEVAKPEDNLRKGEAFIREAKAQGGTAGHGGIRTDGNGQLPYH